MSQGSWRQAQVATVCRILPCASRQMCSSDPSAILHSPETSGDAHSQRLRYAKVHRAHHHWRTQASVAQLICLQRGISALHAYTSFSSSVSVSVDPSAWVCSCQSRRLSCRAEVVGFTPFGKEAMANIAAITWISAPKQRNAPLRLHLI